MPFPRIFAPGSADENFVIPVKFPQPKTLTTANINQSAGTIRRMYSYAKKSGNKELLKHADGLRKHL